MTFQQQRAAPDVPGYEIVRPIGAGGMGEVYLAMQVALNRPVAIKFLSSGPGERADGDDGRFRREAELMARVSHPNVATVFDSGTAAGRPYRHGSTWILVPAPVLIFPASASAASSSPTVTWTMRDGSTRPSA